MFIKVRIQGFWKVEGGYPQRIRALARKVSRGEGTLVPNGYPLPNGLMGWKPWAPKNVRGGQPISRQKKRGGQLQTKNQNKDSYL